MIIYYEWLLVCHTHKPPVTQHTPATLSNSHPSNLNPPPNLHTPPNLPTHNPPLPNPPPPPFQTAILVIYFTRALDYSDDNATAFFHLFKFACYFMPLVGAIVSDGYIGKYRFVKGGSGGLCGGTGGKFTGYST